MRVVVDTNILVSAHLSIRGASRRLLDRLIAVHNVILSDAILDEFTETMRTKFNYDNEILSMLLVEMTEFAEIVEPATFPAQICRDPDDDAILGTAVAGNADCIVTGDSDLLVIERLIHAGVTVDIIAPADFPRYEEMRL